jgi:hypothetical protein
MPKFFGQLCALAVMFVLFLVHDVWQIVTGTVDLNKSLPFLLPIFFALMIGIVLLIKRHEDQKRKA